ncbi:tigger transposable element-derived protein 1 [Trichonephila clavipes]|nr:tigger transposable element-derived protein 1 [Trichonephila clavipes]
MNILHSKVHITKATLQQLDGQFEAEPGNGHQRDQYLADHQVETFLIVPTKKPESLVPLLGEVDLRRSFRTRISTKMSKYMECWGADKPFANISESTLAKNIRLTSLALIETNLLPGADSGCSCRQCEKREDLNPILLKFYDAGLEGAFKNQPDNQFAHSIACVCILFLCNAALQLLVFSVKKNEAAIRKSVISGTKLSTKFASYTRDVLLERTERAIAIRIEEQVQRRIPVSGHLIQEKALQFYKSMKQSEPSTSTSQAGKEFSASKGWLTGFLKRNILHNIKITGESATADEGAAKIFPEELAKIIENGDYSDDQVFNADETRLYWENCKWT